MPRWSPARICACWRSARSAIAARAASRASRRQHAYHASPASSSTAVMMAKIHQNITTKPNAISSTNAAPPPLLQGCSSLMAAGRTAGRDASWRHPGRAAVVGSIRHGCRARPRCSATGRCIAVGRNSSSHLETGSGVRATAGVAVTIAPAVSTVAAAASSVRFMLCPLCGRPGRYGRRLTPDPGRTVRKRDVGPSRVRSRISGSFPQPTPPTL
jgi:hypothetical protein